MATSKAAMALVFASTIAAASGQILIKTGVNVVDPANFVLDAATVVALLPLMIGYFLYAFAAVMLVVALKYGELSVLYPIYAMNFIWVAIMSPIFFPLTDSMNTLKWLGVFAIAAGVGLIGVGSKEGGIESG